MAAITVDGSTNNKASVASQTKRSIPMRAFLGPWIVQNVIPVFLCYFLIRFNKSWQKMHGQNHSHSPTGVLEIEARKTIQPEPRSREFSGLAWLGASELPSDKHPMDDLQQL
jgi:hypothetical protein